MDWPFCRRGKKGLLALAAVSFGVAITSGGVLAATQSGEQKNMTRVGHTDLQGRAAYQPNFIVYPDGITTMLFVGTHNGSRPNPMKLGTPTEQNGTMIIDVSNPANPIERAHIPVPVAGGQAQMARMCLGSQLPKGTSGKVYLLRNIQGSAAQQSGYEAWDVTNPNAPVLVGAMRGIRSTHKLWWECTTGIAYMPGSRDLPVGNPDRWRQAQSMVIADWSDPANPVYLRTFGIPGAQPDSTGPAATSLHGAISAFEHPQASRRLTRGNSPTDDIIGNRIYAAWGVGDDGVLQIIDRKKLLPPPWGTWTPNVPNVGVGSADRPTEAGIAEPLAGILYMSPDQGGHTSFPVFGLAPPSYQNFNEFKTRDIVLLASEATANRCNEAPHWSFVVDVTVESSKTAPPGTQLEPNPWQGPMVLSTMWVDPREGAKYPRGNYCTRGARFGVHSSEENFRNPYYGRLTFLAYFTGGVRVWDIREPQAPVEVGFYVPESNANTSADGYMTNNVEVDNRGIVYVVDRNGAGLDILTVDPAAIAP